MCRRVGRLAVAAVLIPVVAGCGQNSDTSLAAGGFGQGSPNTVIGGAVTCNGRPLTTGAVVFINDRGPVGQGVVMPDGRYQSGLVPDGPVKVVYSSRPIPDRIIRQMTGQPEPPESAERPEELVPVGVTKTGAPAPTGPPPPPAEVLRLAKSIEAKYGHPDKTPLSYTVVRGEQTFDINFVTDGPAPNPKSNSSDGK